MSKPAQPFLSCNHLTMLRTNEVALLVTQKGIFSPSGKGVPSDGLPFPQKTCVVPARGASRKAPPACADCRRWLNDGAASARCCARLNRTCAPRPLGTKHPPARCAESVVCLLRPCRHRRMAKLTLTRSSSTWSCDAICKSMRDGHLDRSSRRQRPHRNHIWL